MASENEEIAEREKATEGVTEPHSKTFLPLICLVASLGGILFGFDTAVISGTFGMIETQFDLSKIAVGWFGSSALIGAILGALMAGTLSDRYGRKPILILAAILFFVSVVGSTIPPTFFILIVARLIGGIGVGLASVLSPLYISEFAPPTIRGRLVALYQLSIVFGILLAYFSNWILSGFAESHSAQQEVSGFIHKIMVSEVWRGMFLAEIIPSGLFLFLLFLVPESPRWLIKSTQYEKAFQILTKVSGAALAKIQFNSIRSSLDDKVGSLKELFKSGAKLAVMVGLGLSVFGQMTGVNVVIYYGPEILANAGFGIDNALQFQIAIGIINLLFTVVAIFKIDKWGRRPLLIGGMASVCVSLFVIAVLFTIGLSASIWMVIMLCIYMASLALSINAVIWVLLGEIYPNRVRGRAMSIATVANWATNFGVAFIFPWYVDKIGMNAGFFTFSGFCLVATVFFYKTIPETKSKSLEEIEKYWDTKGISQPLPANIGS